MLNDNNFSKRYVRIDLCVCVAQSCQTLCDPMDCSSPEMPMACSREPTSHLPLHPISQDCLSALAPSIQYHAWTGYSFHILYYTCFNAFSQIIPPSSSPTESKSLFFTSVSLLLSCLLGHHYHLSKFHIYVLIYSIGVSLSDLFHSK